MLHREFFMEVIQAQKSPSYSIPDQSLFHSPTFIVLLAGQPEASVEVSQHVLVLPCLPDVVDSVGQLLFPYPFQLLLLLRRQRDIGGWVPGVWGGHLWMKRTGVLGGQKRYKNIPICLK